MDVDHAWNERSSAGTAVYSERYGTENGDFSEKTHGRTGGSSGKITLYLIAPAGWNTCLGR